MKRTLTLALASTMLAPLLTTSLAHAETIDVSTGHQSMTTATYPPGVIAQHMGFFEKYLPHDGKNYYLCCSTHETEDQSIYNRLIEHCRRDFPALPAWLEAEQKA